MANEFVIRRGLISLGGVTYPLTEVNNNYTVLTTDYYVSVDAGASQKTLTLPTNGNTGQGFILKNDYNSTANVITAGANIDGETSINIRPGETYQIVWNGSEYLLAGINGTSGSSGSSGTSGSSGSSGTSGSSGSSGTSGSSGSSGTSGSSGSSGTSGSSGSSGTSGSSGSSGTSGSSGSSGTSGSSGSSGTSGSSGSSGTSGSSGSSGTSGSSGSSGTSGSSGSSGTSGSSGSSGTSGSSGSSGTSGSSGSSGTSGSSGSSGTSGSSGSSGTSGSSGSSGTSGSSGSSGTSGSSGSSGTSGSSGSSGTSGSSGSSGTSGSSGSSGTSGSSGSSGTSGSSGSSGTSGSSGSSGTSGSSGSSGTSGSSGSSGTSGAGICNEYTTKGSGIPTSGEISFAGTLVNATSINIFKGNVDSVDYEDYYVMIDGRDLSGTLTITEVNDTDRYVIYEFDSQGASYNTGGGYLTITPSTVYASPLVSATGFSTQTPDVCISFDLFRGVKTVQETGITNTTTNLYSFTQSSYDGAIVDYTVKRTDSTGGSRTGSLYIAWNGNNTPINTDQSTKDVGLTTAGLTFGVTSGSGITTLRATAASGGGTFTVTLSVRPLGTHM